MNPQQERNKKGDITTKDEKKLLPSDKLSQVSEEGH